MPPKQPNPDKYYPSKTDAVAGLIMAGYPNSYIRKATGLHNGLINLIRKQIDLEKKTGEEAEIAAICPLAEAFENFDHSTGENLPLDDPWAVNKAQYLLMLRDKREGFA